MQQKWRVTQGTYDEPRLVLLRVNVTICTKRNAASPARWMIIGTLALAAGCATREPPSTSTQPSPPVPHPIKQAAPAAQSRAAAQAMPATPERPALKPLTGRALVMRLLPAGLADRSGWAGDIHSAMEVLGIEPSASNICAVLAIAGQESDFRTDPAIPDLAGIAHREIEKRRERAGVPKFMVHAALALPSSDGRSYSERLKAASTERQLSDVFEDFSGKVPLAKSFLADRNPVRTGGPMQVSVAFAQAHAAAHPYPYSRSASIREEVFTRRGGLYFGIAHLLHYPAPYDDVRYRFADYNAGRFASRNAAFQKAVSELSGTPLELDGDVLRYEQGQPARERSNTELATLKLAHRLQLSAAEIRRDLELGLTAQFERSRLYAAVFAAADRLHGRPAPRAVVPVIVLQTAKTSRKLTSDGFAARVRERHRACLARA
jgi:uncharacterized protein DUF1615